MLGAEILRLRNGELKIEDGEFCPLDKKEHPVLQGAFLLDQSDLGFDFIDIYVRFFGVIV